MRPNLCALAAIVAALPIAPAWAQTQAPGPLPLQRARLYDTGVGYFERSGTLTGAANDMTLPVPAGHLDDALKTLVVLSNGGKAEVDGIEFGSSVSHDMARRLAGLPAEGAPQIGLPSLLASMKGAAVEIQAGTARHRGRLVEVVDPPEEGERECEVRNGNSADATAADAAATVCVVRREPTLLLLTDQSELLRFRADRVTSVRPTDPAWRARLGSALDALSQRGGQSARKLRILARPGATLALGYVAETPVWRATYRLVLADGGQGGDVLQGWALLHNDTDEDWSKVRVELVNGRPDSFLLPLAAPRYARRELVTPARELSTVPQLLDRTVDNMWSVDPDGTGTVGYGSGYGSGRGSGGGMGSLSGIGLGGGGSGGGGDDVGQSALLAVGNLAALAQADGVESGAMFRYALAQPIDLRAHGSALVPFASERLTVARVVYFESPGAVARVGVHLKNDTRQTFPAGPIAVFESGGFAGETALGRTKPGEQRILRYGFDLDVQLVEAGHLSKDEPRVLRFERGAIAEHFVRHHTVTYSVENRSGAARRAFLALGYVSNAEVKGADGLEYDQESSTPLAVFDAPAGTVNRRVLEVDEGLSRTIAFGALNATRLRKLAAIETLPEAQRTSLRHAAEHLDAADANRIAAATLRQQLERLDEDTRRLRANLAAVGRDSSEADSLRALLLGAEQRYGEARRRADEHERQRSASRQGATALLVKLGG